MRTTVRLPDELLRQAKRYAADRGITLTAILAEGLRARLAEPPRRVGGSRVSRMPVFKGTGPRPGVDLTSTSSLLDLTEKRRGPS